MQSIKTVAEEAEIERNSSQTKRQSCRVQKVAKEARDSQKGNECRQNWLESGKELVKRVGKRTELEAQNETGLEVKEAELEYYYPQKK